MKRNTQTLQRKLGGPIGHKISLDFFSIHKSMQPFYQGKLPTIILVLLIAPWLEKYDDQFRAKAFSLFEEEENHRGLIHIVLKAWGSIKEVWKLVSYI